jgi:hypothetical protein
VSPILYLFFHPKAKIRYEYEGFKLKTIVKNLGGGKAGGDQPVQPSTSSAQYPAMPLLIITLLKIFDVYPHTS